MVVSGHHSPNKSFKHAAFYSRPTIHGVDAALRGAPWGRCPEVPLGCSRESLRFPLSARAFAGGLREGSGLATANLPGAAGLSEYRGISPAGLAGPGPGPVKREGRD